jgi:Zn-finger nucleic acid-binding protein
MQCPVDQTVLVMSERSGVEIDYCPTCRGVWLGRGELDKILDRAAAVAPVEAPRRENVSYPVYDPRNTGHDPRFQGYDPSYRKKKKRSFLDDFFE